MNSGDLISRQAVIESICKQYTEHNAIVPIWLSIGDLPSVTPTEWTGHWIFKQFDEETGILRNYWCSECGKPSAQVYKTYCANCGCRMVES